MDSKTRFETQRRRILALPEPRSAQAWNCDKLTGYLALRDSGLEPGELWCAEITRARLRAMTFMLDDDELLIGRIKLPDKGTPELQTQATAYFDATPWWRSPGQCGHAQPDYQAILTRGVAGMRRDVLAHDCGVFTQCELVALDGFAEMIGHAADTAQAAGNNRLAESCRHLTANAPRDFLEALQLIWFVLLGIEIGERSWLVNPGRLDKLLIPFYRHDLACGTLTREDARDLIAQFYLLLNEHCGASLAYGVMVGGDQVNELSYLCLEALRYSRLIYPSVGICVNRNTPRDLKALAIELIADGLPTPAFFNDEVIRDSLVRRGVPVAEAGDYINSTCVEITPCGASNVFVASPYHNLCQYLLDVMGTSQAASYDAFIADYMATLDKNIQVGVDAENSNRAYRMSYNRRPLESLFTRDCIARGKDIENGGAVYNWVECSFVGLANLVDSLYVIEQEVFRKGAITLAELKSLCETDFAGQENLRNAFLKGYPKYGQDNHEIDRRITPIIQHLKNECERFRMLPDDSHYLPGTFCWIMHQLLGAKTAATPDGRRSGFPFADGAGPAQGRETLGPTSAVRSVTSWSHNGMLGGTAFNMKFSKTILATREAQEKLLALVDVFIAGGGFETQINVVDEAVLLDAQLHPEDHADLIVRIGGYSDYFVRLSGKMQQEVLLRTLYNT